MLESAYEACLVYELGAAGLAFERQSGYRADIIVEHALVIEVKCVQTLLPIHEAQLLTYMGLSGVKIGLLLNFNERYLKDGIKRMVL